VKNFAKVMVVLSAAFTASTVLALVPRAARAACQDPQGVYYTFTTQTTAVSEAGGEAYVAVRMVTSDGCPVRQPASVGFQTGGTVSDSATPGVDYQSVGPASPRLDFSGWPSGTVFLFSPVGFHTAIFDDGVHEGDETFSVRLTGAVGCAPAWGPGLNPPALTTNFVSIRDDDPAQTLSLSFKYGDTQIPESVGAVSVAVQLSTSDHQPSQCGATVSYATADDLGGPHPAANAGLDYVASSGQRVFPPGTLDGGLLSISVPIVDDGAGEPEIEVLHLTLSNPVSCGIPVQIGPYATHWINIVDDDAAATADVYRLFSLATGEHLYTTDLHEYTTLPESAWNHEGRTFRVFSTPGLYQGVRVIPLYRLYHTVLAQHLWTTDLNEYNALGAANWLQEGIAAYVLPASSGASGTVPLYRLAYPPASLHLWTIDFNEYTVLKGYGWGQEGVVADVLP
jgi:hypothetical protein